MIVIEGKNEKSKILENLIRKEFRTNKVVIIDSVGVDRLSSDDWATVWKLDNVKSYKEVIDVFKNEQHLFKQFDWIAFYVNADKEAIEDFKELDRTFNQNFIVTIQAENGLTSKYHI